MAQRLASEGTVDQLDDADVDAGDVLVPARRVQRRPARSGAERLCAALEALGVEHVFGVPATQNVALYDALRRSRVRSVVATHELAASFMAGAYHRASGRVAPLVTMPGPGFTYALTGLAEALHDSAALVHLTGEPVRGERPFQFQTIDQRAIATPLVKGMLRAGTAAQTEDAVTAAFQLAVQGEPGPVLVELSAASLEDESARGARSVPAVRTSAPLEGDTAARLDGAASLLASSRRPLLMAGQGCAGAAPALRELAELLGAPVFTTVSGRGVLPEDHPLALAFDPARGEVRALNELAARCDCLAAIGCKLGAAGTDGFAFRLPEDRLIQLDASAEVLGATYPGRLAIAARAEDVLPRLVAAVRRLPEDAPPRWGAEEVASWRKRLRELSSANAVEPAFHGVAPETAEAFFAALQRALPRDAIVVTDSGLHQTLARRHLRILSPRGLLVPSDFQSMGFGLPAAIGAKLAAPGRSVVAILGDGGFLMSGMELLTAVRERLPVTVVVFNDGQLNRIRLQQLAQLGRSAGCEILNPDFEAFAGAAGARYALCEGDAEGILRTAVASPEPTLVEVRVGDSASIHLERAKGLARGTARRALGRSAFGRLKRLLRGK